MAILKQAYNLIAIVAIVHLLMLIGLVGFLAGTGKLNAESLDRIAAVLRGEEPVPAVGQEQHPVSPTATSAPASQPTTIGTPATLTLEEQQAKLAVLERQERLVKDLFVRLQDAQLKLIKERRDLQRQQETFRKQVQQQRQAAMDESFAKALALYGKLSPKQAKDNFMQLDVDSAVRYLSQMPERKAANILKQFKSTEEQVRLRQIMERLSTRGLGARDKQG